uniref:Major facilitator superfamily (MFS) profile domain-containing protein n=1 Tax=Megaselia scalaris TaxID=36166 RepID=T1GZV1_MEGSC
MPKNKRNKKSSIQEELALTGAPGSKAKAIPTADGKFPKARHVLGLLGFTGFAMAYAMRVNLSVAMVAMVNQTFVLGTNGENTTNPNV